MQYIKQAIFYPNDHTNKDSLTRFWLQLTNNSMYRPIIDEISQLPGFVKREIIMTDDGSRVTAISKLIFADSDSFKVYIEHEGYQSIWEYVKIMAENDDIHCEISDLVIQE